MVHTAKFFMNLSKKDMIEIINKFDNSITLVDEVIDENFNWSTTTIYFDSPVDEIEIKSKSKSIKRYGRNCWVLQVVVDFIKLLNKTNIEDTDYKTIEEEMDRYMYFIFGHTRYKMTFSRIDYRIDIKMDKQDREVLLMILTKSHQKYGFKKLKTTEDIIGKKKYEELKKENDMKNIETTLYFQSKSIGIQIYDKEIERKNKNIEPEEYEKNTLRMEVMLYNRHLNYKKTRYHVSKELKTYFKKRFFKRYIAENLEKFIHKGDYYKINISKNIINNSNLTEKQKKFLNEFLIDVSRSNLTNIMKLKNKNGKLKYNYSKRKIALDLLKELDINPISIPKNWKCKNYITNPLKYI